MMSTMYRQFIFVVFLSVSTLLAQPENGHHSPKAEILWDSYGVPHIFAKENAGLFRAFGYAQMESHGDLVLRLYGEARGRAAEYWGASYLPSDQWVWTNGIPARAEAWYRAQSPEFRQYLDAFADGMNEFARLHADRLTADARVVLPVTAVDVLAHTERVLLYTFISSPWAVQATVNGASPPRVGASNAWAIAPKRTADGHAMLLANPHLPWDDLFRFYEAEWTGRHVRIYGATLVGFPVLAIAFNERLGWTHTVNPIEAHTVYELTPANGGYRYDGSVRPFDTKQVPLKIKQDDGSMRTEQLLVRQSVYGPVVLEKNGKMYAMAVGGVNSPGACEEWWKMGRARDRKQFEAALSRLQIPMFNVVYADRAGHILYVFNGDVPVHATGNWDYWSRVVSGDTSATQWNSYHRYQELPRVADPASGWLQNTNDPPWSCTYPAPLSPASFPPYMSLPSGEIGFRARRSAYMLYSEPKFTLDKLVGDKYSTHSELADCMLDELLTITRKSDDIRAKQAVEILSHWDRSFNSDSKGAVLFAAFVMQLMKGGGAHPFDVRQTASDPLTTPQCIADPARELAALLKAADTIQKQFGTLDPLWGDTNRFVRGAVDLPGNGGPDWLGVFRVIDFAPVLSRHAVAVSGDSFIAAVEFSKPVQARVLLTYGNSSQPGSAHLADQLPLAEHRELRRAWLTRTEVVSHLESIESLK